MRRAAKVDANQPAIVAALRAVGATVQPLHTVGKGCPDLLVGYQGRDLTMEVKDPVQPTFNRRLKPDQVIWHGQWRGRPVAVVETVDQAIAALKTPFTAARRRIGDLMTEQESRLETMCLPPMYLIRRGALTEAELSKLELGRGGIWTVDAPGEVYRFPNEVDAVGCVAGWISEE